jgi:hypothetical protein
MYTIQSGAKKVNQLWIGYFSRTVEGRMMKKQPFYHQCILCRVGQKKVHQLWIGYFSRTSEGRMMKKQPYWSSLILSKCSSNSFLWTPWTSHFYVVFLFAIFSKRFSVRVQWTFRILVPGYTTHHVLEPIVAGNDGALNQVIMYL